jgi:prevent-host-death family protein
MHWQLQDAKNRFSQVVDLARREGPQAITLRGKEAAVVISIEEYRRLTRPQGKLSDFFQQSPLAGADLDVTRSDDVGRDIEL